MGDPSEQDVANALKTFGVSPADAANAAQQYAVIDANVGEGIRTIAQNAGQVKDLTTALPIIAAGLSMTGVGAPAVAIVTAGIGVVQNVLNAIGLNAAQPAPKCAWRGLLSDEQAYYQSRNLTDEPYLGVCIDPSTELPYGPKDNGWQQIHTWLNTGGDIVKLAPSGFRFGTWPSSPGTAQSQADIINMSSKSKFDTRLDPFLTAFREIWLLNAERALNGHKSSSQYGLLQAFTNGWNTTHQGPTITLNPGASANDPNRDRSGGPINDLLNGLIDGTRHPPLAINVGPLLPRPTTAHKIILHKPILKQMHHTQQAKAVGIFGTHAQIVQKASIGVGASAGAIAGFAVAGPVGGAVGLFLGGFVGDWISKHI